MTSDDEAHTPSLPSVQRDVDKNNELEKPAGMKRKRTLVLNRIEFPIEDENGIEIPYYLLEMDGVFRDQFLTLVRKRQQIINGQPTGFGNFDGFMVDLICRCLRHPADNKLVPAEIIKRWPATLQKECYVICRQLNGLDEEEEEKEKND